MKIHKQIRSISSNYRLFLDGLKTWYCYIYAESEIEPLVLQSRKLRIDGKLSPLSQSIVNTSVACLSSYT